MKYNNIGEAIGKTPLVKLNQIATDIKYNMFAKCEFLNPGGSTKDRIAREMIDAAEAQGIIQPGDTLIEPTSGNTGIGIAMVGAARGYNVIITMPEKMSNEKQRVLEALGAKIIRTPTDVAYDDPKSHICVAQKLQASMPRAHILDQYKNLANPQAHSIHTAQEIYNDMDGKIDMIVVGVGTGGSITGIAQAFRSMLPQCLIIGADPYGSLLAPEENPSVHSYFVEGIGYDFIPEVLQRELVHQWVKVSDENAFLYARYLIQKEGLLCGGSSGAVLYAALQAGKHLKPDQNCVLILADSIRNYLSKFVHNPWLKERGFQTPDF